LLWVTVFWPALRCVFTFIVHPPQSTGDIVETILHPTRARSRTASKLLYSYRMRAQLSSKAYQFWVNFHG
jgi:hypothetical protein